ncbi:hypothetical protein L484_019338 [Morus notabilis]|uniref:Uncharacterized protein n=1 Tax=Morus notabilis TaxID=981085 RepID=W9QPC0_9ROSA|nr:hypothetical protein L484_019338 [Morus notabilis]
MQALEERRREKEESEEDDRDFEDEDKIGASKRKWWKRALSLLMRNETGEGSAHQQFGRDIVMSESRENEVEEKLFCVYLDEDNVGKPSFPPVELEVRIIIYAKVQGSKRVPFIFN